MVNVKEHTLFLDVGNSFIKAAYRTGTSIWIDEVIRFARPEEVVEWISEESFNFGHFVISGVVEDRVASLKNALGTPRCTELKVSHIPSKKLSYDTPETLGVDRFLACLGAHVTAQEAVVVIDAGTACTVDLMTSNGVFEGGVIMPGLGIIKKALQDHAPALPQVEEEIPAIWPGKSTYTSIQWGTAGILKDTLEAQLARYRDMIGEFKIYITGGDAETVQGLINAPSIVDDKLVFLGMDAFLELFLDKS